MLREEAIKELKIEFLGENDRQREAKNMAIKALEQEPYEKFESTKDHIYKLAGDYKCWDNRLTQDEALELCHILEQQPCEDCISRKEMLKYQEYLHGKMSNEENFKLWEFIKGLPPVTPQEPNYKSFCEFVAKTTMEEDFELNAGANAEIFCRKLAKLGIVKANGDEWELLEQEPKIGRWIMHDYHRECSECKVYLPKHMTRNSYCPNCGCKMSEYPSCSESEG